MSQRNLLFIFIAILSLFIIESTQTATCVCRCCIPSTGECLSADKGNFTTNSCVDNCNVQSCFTYFEICRIPDVTIDTTCAGTHLSNA